ncbi:CrpP-related protein [Roseateles asaccharophilus]|uniref:Uncharacterized protein n=1 Tax=Roseateles asaccharophilus TaxID=582607 RepID=A0ABU2AEK8_9BURK|nr:CrpP-related protein [Roseateles asaccharophilus]MDR7335647.1 hypothetical protein [Roseateles asaccharophilus]
MKRPTQRPHPGVAPPSREAVLSSPERSELLRQGAKAAARGEDKDSNPLSQPRNRPPATGESAAHWLQRSDAWTLGHETQSRIRNHGLLAWAPVVMPGGPPTA